MRKRIYQIIQKASKGDKWSYVYDIFMLAIILASIIPLTVIGEKPYFAILEIITTSVFIIDYILRWATADYKLNKRTLSFVLYPFTPMAIMDFLSILPTFHLLAPSYKLTKAVRLLKIFRFTKIVHYFAPLEIFVTVLKKQWKLLLAVLFVAFFDILVTAIIIFQSEHEIDPVTGEYVFKTFYDAVYWAAITLSTVGYGDLYPVSNMGKTLSIFSSLLGIAIIALPSSIVTAGYMQELSRRVKTRNEDEERKNEDASSDLEQ
jgi:voltage-gated potassium channel